MSPDSLLCFTPPLAPPPALAKMSASSSSTLDDEVNIYCSTCKAYVPIPQFNIKENGKMYGVCRKHGLQKKATNISSANENPTFCGSCKRMVPESQFNVKPDGSLYRVCQKHGLQAKAVGKSSQARVTEISEVLQILQNMVKQNENFENTNGRPLEFTLSMDTTNLPSRSDLDKVDGLGIFDAYADNLVKSFYARTGIRVICRSRRGPIDSRSYTYYCAYSNSMAHTSQSKGLRDRHIREFVPCKGEFRIHFNNIRRAIYISTLHRHIHGAYVNKEMPDEVGRYIRERPDDTPSQLYQDIRAKMLVGYEHVTQDQVYYWWSHLFSDIWKKDPDPIKSTEVLLRNNQNDYEVIVDSVKGNCGIVFFISETIDALRFSSELAIDATYGTNDSGMSFYAILAELDGTGVPLCYMFLESNLQEETRRCALRQPLVKLQQAGLTPKFFAMDKDFAEIRAVRDIFPDCKIQLCYWHVRRAL